MVLTKQQKDDYIKHPNHCPFCNSKNIKQGDMRSRIKFCNECGKMWDEVYGIKDIKEVER
jgi:ribosomal protein L37AE/L43A